MKYLKPPLSIADQIKQLEARGLIVGDGAKAEAALTHISYYRLRGYWLPFEADVKKHQFRPGARLDAVIDLYEFDRKLRMRVMDAVERVEVSARTRWTYCVSLRHGAHAYLDSKLFHDSIKYAESLQTLQVELGRSKETFVEHYKKTYTDPPLPPLWAISEVFSLGHLSKWIENITEPSLRAEIAQPYQLDERVLVSFLHHLTVIRNICAHHGRLWNRRVGLRPQLPRKKPAHIVDSFNPESEGYLYNTLTMLAHLLDCVAPGNRWRTQLNELLSSHPAIPLQSMGFPSDWKTRSVWVAIP